MDASTTHRVMTAAKAAAETFVAEFGGDHLQASSDWDSAAYESDNCGWPDAAWPLYQSTLQAEITRLQAKESAGVEVEDIGGGFSEAADGTVIG